MRSLFMILCCLTISSSTLLCRELNGTVYADHSGPSGKGVGVVHLATKAGLIEIYYQKPIKEHFSNVRCREVGAIWAVKTRQTSPGTEVLVSASCDGRVDRRVHSAWIATRSYIETVARAAGHEVGYKPGRRGPVNLKMDEVQVDVSGYLDFGSTGMCLEMKKRVDSKTVIIESSADCYFIPDLDFRVEQVAAAAWRVTSVTAVVETR